MPTATPDPRDAPAFDFYPERWTHGTQHLTKAERCDYLHLLCHQWTDNGLPADLDLIARLIGYRRGDQIPPLVLEKFPLAEDGRRRNKRLEIERDKQRARITKRRLGAQKTNQKRWQTPAAPKSPASAPPPLASPSPSDRSATPQRPLSDSPPPTSHHPPTNQTSGSESQGYRAPVPPPALEAVQHWALAVMAPGPCAEAFWHDHEARGWTDRTGQKITNPRAAFNAFATRWKANTTHAPPRHSLRPSFPPRHPAYQTATATTGLTPADISQFTPGQA